MPLPNPKSGESQSDFISRCMSNDAIQKEFGKGSKQAVAVCHSQWRAKHSGKPPAKEMMEKSKMDNLNLIYSAPIKVIETRETAEGIEPEFQIEGVALNAITTDNSHKFLAEELKSASNTLAGVPLLKDHDNSVDSIMGRVTFANYDSKEQNIKFKANIKDDKIKTMIKDGRLTSVSIGANVNSIEEEDEVLVPRGIKFKELSLVAVPADDGAEFTTFKGSNFNMAISEAWIKGKDEEKNPEDELDLDDNQSHSNDIVVNDNTIKKEEKEMEEDKKETSEVSSEEKTSKEEDNKAEEKMEEIQKKLDAQAGLLSDTINKIGELTKAISVKESDADEKPKEEVKEPEEKVEEPKVEPQEEKVEDPKEDNEKENDSEEVAEEKSNYKVLSDYRSFTVLRNKY